jgi:hypothetical protein
VELAILYTIAGTVVTRRHGYSDAHVGRILEGRVHGVVRLLGPAVLGLPPTDRNDGRLAGGVMGRGGDGIVESRVRVVGEIDYDLGAGCDGPGHFDVQHDLGIGFATRLILSAANRNCRHLWCVDSKLIEIRVEIVGAVTTAEFDA